MYFLFADVRTGYMVVYTGKAKDSFLEAFKSEVEYFRRFGHEVKAFRSDAETVLMDGKMGAYFCENGFIHEISTPEAHYQTFIERYSMFKLLRDSPLHSCMVRTYFKESIGLGRSFTPWTAGTAYSM